MTTAKMQTTKSRSPATKPKNPDVFVVTPVHRKTWHTGAQNWRPLAASMLHWCIVSCRLMMWACQPYPWVAVTVLAVHGCHFGAQGEQQLSFLLII